MKQIVAIVLLLTLPNDLRTSNSFRKSIRRMTQQPIVAEREVYEQG